MSASALLSGSRGYQQVLIRERAPAGCFKAFLNNNGFGAAVFAGLVLDYLYKSF